MKNINKIAIASVFVCASLAVGTASDATPTRSYSGISCQPMQSSADGSRELNGGIYNQSTRWGDYLCPTVHQWAGALARQVKVRVIDKHSSKNVYCHAYSRTASGSSASWAGRGSTGFSTSYQTLTLSTAAYGDGVSFLRCSVPERHTTNGPSGVLGYTAL